MAPNSPPSSKPLLLRPAGQASSNKRPTSSKYFSSLITWNCQLSSYTAYIRTRLPTLLSASPSRGKRTFFARPCLVLSVCAPLTCIPNKGKSGLRCCPSKRPPITANDAGLHGHAACWYNQDTVIVCRAIASLPASWSGSSLGYTPFIHAYAALTSSYQELAKLASICQRPRACNTSLSGNSLWESCFLHLKYRTRSQTIAVP